MDAVEKKLAELEGGVGAMCTSSGQAASFLSIINLCSAGDSFISTSTIYGGTVNLFAVTLKRLGVECIFVDPEATEEELQKVWVLRKVINPMDDAEIMELLIDKMKKTKNNETFLRTMNTAE